MDNNGGKIKETLAVVVGLHGTVHFTNYLTSDQLFDYLCEQKRHN